MKLVFFSSDKSEIQRLAKELEGAGVPCEVRKHVMVEGETVHLPETELWVQHDSDARRAFEVCVEHNAGFARREIKGFATDSSTEDMAA